MLKVENPQVLIAPLWNWNALAQHGKALKYGSNCTFMELKSASERSQPLSFLRSNCTFMELKWKMGRQTNGCNHVLIVPLWNWNDVQKLAKEGEKYCSNCTFMELKWWYPDGGYQILSRSNCTFMELKFV